MAIAGLAAANYVVEFFRRYNTSYKSLETSPGAAATLKRVDILLAREGRKLRALEDAVSKPTTRSKAASARPRLQGRPEVAALAELNERLDMLEAHVDVTLLSLGQPKYGRYPETQNKMRQRAKILRNRLTCCAERCDSVEKIVAGR